MDDTEDPLNGESKRNPNRQTSHRGKNFSAADDRNICIAWLAISNDPLKGRDQQGDAFWKEVQEHAKIKKRSWNAVRQRWGLISRCVMKFSECFKAVNNRAAEGKLVGSVYDETIDLYLTTTNAKKWPFSECFEILRKSPKFNHYHQMKANAANANHPILAPHSQSHSFADTDNYDTESNIGRAAFFGDFNSTSDPSIAYAENGNDLENGFEPNDYDDQIPYDSRQDLDRRRVEALEVLAKAAERKNELLAKYIGAMNAATDAKYVTQSTQHLDPLSLQILELKKIKILTALRNADTKQ
ncbi:hypothetical protein HA402_014326 [Bradysia odoriphaga]|nr:hypothetical protein HA402_014326 [Bradysia odoriphaga]